METVETIDRLESVAELGVEWAFDTEWVGEPGVDRREIKIPDRIRSVKIPWTSQDWAMVARRDGAYYMGGCCGNMSLLQDHINAAFRDGDWIGGPEFIKIAEMCRGHDGFDEFEPMDDATFIGKILDWKLVEKIISGEVVDERVPDPSKVCVDPWFKLGVVFSAVESYLQIGWQDEPKKDLSNERYTLEDNIVRPLSNALTRLSFADLFHVENEDQQHANKELVRAKVYPLAKKLVAEMEAEGISFEGWGIVDPRTEEIYADSNGLCIYSDYANAERVVLRWRKWAIEEEERERKRADDEEPFDHDGFWRKRESEIAAITLDGSELKVVR